MSRVSVPQGFVREFAIGLALQIVVTWAFSAWGSWVARRRGGGDVWKWAPRAPWISFALLMVGVVVSIAMLLRAFERVSSGSAAAKAQSLSDGIAHAMTVTAIFFVPGYLVLFAFVVAAVVGSLQPPAGNRKET
jgi:hypothetical protein